MYNKNVKSSYLCFPMSFKKYQDSNPHMHVVYDVNSQSLSDIDCFKKNNNFFVSEKRARIKY